MNTAALIIFTCAFDLGCRLPQLAQPLGVAITVLLVIGLAAVAWLWRGFAGAAPRGAGRGSRVAGW